METLMKVVTGFLIAVIVFAMAALGFVFSGGYNVAASVPHTAVGAWLLDTVKRRSIEARARSVQAPADLTEEQARRGFREFDEMCAACHGAPGKEPNAAGKGLLPEPPALNEAVRTWNRPQLFWIVKNGIKLTGMPAFGATHDDETIWNIVAFVERLPKITPEEYSKLQSAAAAPAPASPGTAPAPTHTHDPSHPQSHKH